MAENLVCVDDYEKYALSRLPIGVRDYYKRGSGSEFTVEWNQTAFNKYRIRPRVLRDVSQVDTSVKILGESISMPLGVAPSAAQCMAHPDGELASARAAEQAGTIFILSTVSTSSIEQVSSAAPNAIKWFQLYVFKDRTVSQNLVKRAENAGFKALVVTVDVPISSTRRADVKNKFAIPRHLNLQNFEDNMNKMKQSGGSIMAEYAKNLYDPSLEWKDIQWLKSITRLPIIIKGILTAEDAILGIESGASAIMVSNHGGRQLDATPATIEVLPEIVRAVNGAVDVYLDGGIRQGTDVFKALALGAKMVFVGRPVLWGLVHNGEQGARAVLELLKKEIRETLALTGCRSLEEVTRDMVVHESVYSRL